MKNTTPKIWQNPANINHDFLIQIIYKRQLASSKTRGHPNPDYDLNWLNNWIKTRPEFPQLFDAWVSSGCQTLLIPSVDRFDDSIPYTKENLHKVMTWEENKRRGEVLRGQGVSNHKRYREVHQFTLDGVYVNSYHSSRYAYLSLNAKATTHIIDVCEGRRSTAIGFIWSYDRNGSDVLSKIKYSNSTLKGRAVCGFKEDDYVEMPTIYSGMNVLKIQGANILKCLNKERQTAGGYSWKYLDEYSLEILNEIEQTAYNSSDKIHHSKIQYNEDTCLVSILP